MPLVSVILPSYNHEHFIGQAIESVLSQTFQDYEFLISDDCSTDNTADVINSYNDVRIKKNFFAENQGAVENHRFLIEQASGKYIALINSDDVWLPERLQKQVDFMEENEAYGACFSWASFIDENDNEIMKKNKLFFQPNRTRGQWLAHFFMNGNCICHPSMLIKKEVYDEVGLYNNALRQLPDFDMWVRVVKKYDIHIIQEVLVQHRRFINGGGINTSAPITSNSLRDIIESYYILRHFFDDVSNEMFVEGFGKYFRDKHASGNDALACEKFFLMLDSKYYIPKINYMAAILFMMENSGEGVKRTLNDSYEFSERDFFALSAQIDLLGMLPQKLDIDNNGSDFDIAGYIRKNKMKSIAYALFNVDSGIYRFLKKIYKIIRK